MQKILKAAFNLLHSRTRKQRLYRRIRNLLECQTVLSRVRTLIQYRAVNFETVGIIKSLSPNSNRVQHRKAVMEAQVVCPQTGQRQTFPPQTIDLQMCIAATVTTTRITTIITTEIVIMALIIIKEDLGNREMCILKTLIATKLQQMAPNTPHTIIKGEGGIVRVNQEILRMSIIRTLRSPHLPQGNGYVCL